jgi:hypothetical protein
MIFHNVQYFEVKIKHSDAKTADISLSKQIIKTWGTFSEEFLQK